VATESASAPLEGKTMFMSGGSRGVGLAIALRAAKDGANVALIAKTDEPHPKLPGTIHTAAEEIRDAGGQAMPIVGDIRDADAVEKAVERAVEEFYGQFQTAEGSTLRIHEDEAEAMDASERGQERVQVKRSA